MDKVTKNDSKNAYGIDFEGKKDSYIQLIKQTKDDFAYYCTMAAIVEDLGSYHTGLCFPNYEAIENLNCYNLEEVLDSKNFRSYTNYWQDVIKKACKEYSYVSMLEFNKLMENTL